VKDYYCFEMSFPNTDFDVFMENSENSNSIHHAHLFTKDQIEIRIYYDSKTWFAYKLSRWIEQINWKTFGSFIKTSKENQNKGLQRIDFSNSTLLRVTSGSNSYEGELKFVSILIDSVKLYLNPTGNKLNTGEFYLGESSFEVVKDFYKPVSRQAGEFKISRMDKMHNFYSLEHCEFRPEFNFYYED